MSEATGTDYGQPAGGGHILRPYRPPGWVEQGHIQAPGLVARFTAIPHATRKGTLPHPIRLPALLNNLTLTETANHSEYDTIGAGQFSQAAMGPPSARQLIDLPIDTLVMAWEPKWFVWTGQNPLEVRKALRRILRSKTPVRLLITWHPHPKPQPEVDLHVTFRQMDRELRAGENDTRYITVTLKEWRDPSVRARGHRPSKGHGRRHSHYNDGGHFLEYDPNVDLPTTVRLQSWMTLDDLSYRFYGNFRHWRRIRDANGMPRKWGSKSLIVKIGGRWKVGAKIRIPAIDSSGGVPVSQQGV